MNWLVTGGCGFIGSRLVRHLQEDENASVRILDDLSVGSRQELGDVTPYSERHAEGPDPAIPGVELVIGDVRDADAVEAAMHGIDAIVHLAGNTGVQPSIADPRMDCETNVLGTLNCLEAARRAGTRRVVFASSGGTVIGNAEPPIDETMVPRPLSPYGASKSACEGYLSAYHGSFGIETIALRFGNVYGPGSSRKGSVVAKFVREAIAGQTLRIFGDGDQTRDFIYIDDLIEAIVRAAHADGVGGEVFQIASERETSINELAAILIPMLEQRLARPIPIEHGEGLAGEVRRNYSDTSKAAAMLGWKPRTSLPEGLSRTVDWFISSTG